MRVTYPPRDFILLLLTCWITGLLFLVTTCTATAPTDETEPAETGESPETTDQTEPQESQPGSPESPEIEIPSSFILPTQDGKWSTPFQHTGRKPAGTGKVIIDGIGDFSFDASQVTTLRSDIFKPGYFSVFDVLVYLSENGDISMDYHFDGNMDTHIIDTINGEPNWWYQAKYSSGWYESNVFRMDMYPYKDGAEIRLTQRREEYIARICRTFGDEMVRLMGNREKVIIPEVIIQSPRGTRKIFTDVQVTAHNIRGDILQPGTVTALDILLSLGEEGKLKEIKLTWYESIGAANPVDSYWVEQIDEDVAFGGCGFVYETGPREFAGFAGSHIHIPLDVRVIVSPDYAFWFWICL